MNCPITALGTKQRNKGVLLVIEMGTIRIRAMELKSCVQWVPHSMQSNS